MAALLHQTALQCTFIKQDLQGLALVLVHEQTQSAASRTRAQHGRSSHKATRPSHNYYKPSEWQRGNQLANFLCDSFGIRLIVFVVVPAIGGFFVPNQFVHFERQEGAPGSRTREHPQFFPDERVREPIENGPKRDPV